MSSNEERTLNLQSNCSWQINVVEYEINEEMGKCTLNLYSNTVLEWKYFSLSVLYTCTLFHPKPLPPACPIQTDGSCPALTGDKGPHILNTCTCTHSHTLMGTCAHTHAHTLQMQMHNARYMRGLLIIIYRAWWRGAKCSYRSLAATFSSQKPPHTKLQPPLAPTARRYLARFLQPCQGPLVCRHPIGK